MSDVADVRAHQEAFMRKLENGLRLKKLQEAMIGAESFAKMIDRKVKALLNYSGQSVILL